MNGSNALEHSISANPSCGRVESAPHIARRLPRHIGFIPDGNRRWAVQQGLPKDKDYAQGIAPGLALFEACKRLGVEEVSVYGFTQDNTRRPSEQSRSFRAACIAFALEIWRRGAALLVIGDDQSKQFPADLPAFRIRQGTGIKVNFLVNYDWEWDLAGLKHDELRSADVSRMDMVVRWGGGRRLSGFLPVQSVYATSSCWMSCGPTFGHSTSTLHWPGSIRRTARSAADARERGPTHAARGRAAGWVPMRCSGAVHTSSEAPGACAARIRRLKLSAHTA